MASADHEFGLLGMMVRVEGSEEAGSLVVETIGLGCADGAVSILVSVSIRLLNASG